MNTKNLGIFTEGIARTYLIKKGYQILCSNYKTKLGEIDIIGKKEKKIIFFEVKANRINYSGNFSPEIRVNQEKKNKLAKIATFYLTNNNLNDFSWQIDIISITFDLNFKKAHIKHFKNI